MGIVFWPKARLGLNLLLCRAGVAFGCEGHVQQHGAGWAVYARRAGGLWRAENSRRARFLGLAGLISGPHFFQNSGPISRVGGLGGGLAAR